MAFTCDEAYEKCSKYFPMKDTGHLTDILILIFFNFLGIIVALA